MALPIPTDVLSIRPITTLQEAIDASDVRNTGREFMTHDQHEIGHGEQTQWYYNHYKAQHRRSNMFGFVGYVALEPAAYGMVSRRSGDYWLTGVVAPEMRGQGYGKQLFEHLGSFVLNGLDDVVSVDVQERNTPARNLYEGLGYAYEEPMQQNGILIMRKVRDDDWAA